MNVAVGFQAGNVIPKRIGDEEVMDLQRFEIDSEDGTIYTRSTIRAVRKEIFVESLAENKVEVLICDEIADDLAEAVKNAGYKLVTGVSGNTIQAAMAVAYGK